MEIIKFEGNEYPTAILNMPFGKRKISVLKLNESLMNVRGGYVSERARMIDEEIFYYVDEEDFQLTKGKLANKILSEI